MIRPGLAYNGTARVTVDDNINEGPLGAGCGCSEVQAVLLVQEAGAESADQSQGRHACSANLH